MGLSTHVLDTMHGTPAAGMAVALYTTQGEQATLVRQFHLNDDGRAPDGPLYDAASLKVGTYRLVPVAAPSHLVQHGMPETPAELSGARCLINLNMSPRGRWPFIGPGGVSVIAEVDGGLQIDNGEAQLSAALAGAGVVYLPVDLVRGPIADGSLVHLLPHWQTLTLPIPILYPSRRLVPPRVRVFMDAIATALAD